MLSLAAFATVMGGHAAVAATLKEAVQTTIAKHPVLQRDVALSRAAEKGIDQANAGFLPTIDVDSEAGYEYTNSPSTRGRSTKGPKDSSGVSRFRQDNNFTFRQMAFDGFFTSNTAASARATYEGSKDAVTFTGELLGVRTVQLYVDVLRKPGIRRLCRKQHRRAEPDRRPDQEAGRRRAWHQRRRRPGGKPPRARPLDPGAAQGRPARRGSALS